MALDPSAFYAAANLKSNPFRSNPVHSTDPRMDIWVGYRQEKRNFIKFLTRSRSDQIGNLTFIMIHGTWGTGKSHALLWAKNRIENIEANDFDSYCYYIPTLKKDKGRLSFAGAFVQDLVEKTDLKRQVMEFRQWLSTKIVKYRDQKEFDSSVTDPEVIEQLIPAVELYNFAKEIHACEDEDQVGALLAPKGLADYQAMSIFTRLSNLFVFPVELQDGIQRFKKTVYLMVDELDDLLRASVKEAREVNDTLRHIYDACPNCFSLIVALTAEVALFPSIFEDHLLSRIQKQIALGELHKDGAIDFVKQVLDTNRVNESGPTGFYPMDEEAVDVIVNQLVNITPRVVVDTMQQVLEELRLAGLEPNVKPAGVAFLDRWEILDEVVGQGAPDS